MLHINKEDVIRYLGLNDQNIDDQTAQEISLVTKQLQQTDSWKVTYRIFSLEKSKTKVDLLHTALSLQAKSALQLLVDCDQCILLAVTLGSQVDQLLTKTQLLNISHAYVMDCCASSMVEELMNDLELKLKEEWMSKGMFFTDRFSPGYGDLSLDYQKQICSILETQKLMGLTLSSFGTMVPTKSITAIIGIASKPQKMRIKGCQYCDFINNCHYRKGGKRCGS
ncbi:hypothetical protein [Tannockella kyphosi]|uniref:hypothetical protein n=1 Tax=Tannockella kyphosi TaxID=2899121 RepID=UPI0020137B2F|nr:hypothetical protein [Tannockella kyphosi]